jgi:hypothetical protein
MRKLKLTEICQKRFLKALAETRKIGAAAAVAGTSRTRVYELRQENPAFAEAWRQALEVADDPLSEPADRTFRAKAALAAALISGEITPREAADLSRLIDGYFNSVEIGRFK